MYHIHILHGPLSYNMRHNTWSCITDNIGQHLVNGLMFMHVYGYEWYFLFYFMVLSLNQTFHKVDKVLNNLAKENCHICSSVANNSPTSLLKTFMHPRGSVGAILSVPRAFTKRISPYTSIEIQPTTMYLHEWLL